MCLSLQRLIFTRVNFIELSRWNANCRDRGLGQKQDGSHSAMLKTECASRLVIHRLPSEGSVHSVNRLPFIVPMLSGAGL